MCRILVLILMLLCIPISQAEQKVFTQLGSSFWNTSTIHAYFFEEKDTALRIIDEGPVQQPLYGSLYNAMMKHHCIAGINGSYFAADKKHSPIGLLICKGAQLSPFASKGFTVAGILYDTGKGITLERSTKRSTPLIQMKEALQAGPLLVENGGMVAGLNSTKIAARSFIATNGKGQWCIAMASATSLYALAQKLIKDETLGNFHVQTAMNLDGGSSCAFWVQSTQTYYPSYKQVRNYIGLIPRSPK